MFKKIFAIATLLCALPVLANAWTLTTYVKSQGGTITSNNTAPAAQTVLNGSVTKNYASSGETVVVTPSTGWKISKLEKNGIVSGPFTSAQTITAAPGSTQKVYATFARLSYAVTATAGANGTVDKSSYPIAYPGIQSPPKTFVFTPFTGLAVTDITVVGSALTNGVDYQYVNAVTGMPTALGLPNVKVKVNIINVKTTSIAVSASFGAVAANAGQDQTVLNNTLVTLDGSGTPTFAWTQTSGPVVVVLAGAGTANPTFTPTVAGTYVFTVNASDSVTINVTNSIVQSTKICVNCHDSQGVGPTVYAGYSTSSIHKTVGVVCYNCHAGANAGGHPGTVQCTTCHNSSITPNLNFASCATCHSGTNIHTLGTAIVSDDCIACHAVAAPQHGPTLVGDNDGVRAITGEFSKWSHHVTGRAVTNVDCAVCHLEGMVSGAAIVVDPAYHMVDNKTHLRNANDVLPGNQTTATVGAGGQSEYAWNPASPNHTLMDQFCMSCHNTAGAVTAVAALAAVPPVTVARTAINPFGDTISNDYDLALRGGVVAVFEQFDTGNTSHHAVRGKRYTTSTFTGTKKTQVFSQISSANNNAAYLTSPANAFNAATKASLSKTNLTTPIVANVATDIDGAAGTLTFSGPYNSATGFVGTLYETGKFITSYTTLGTTATIKDDTINHCGDCHSVGQFRKADVGVLPNNQAVIGAHGSNNEYMLRNNNGTDVLSAQALVCFNCHAEAIYGNFGHEGTNSADGDCNGDLYNVAGRVGAARLVPEEDEITDAEFQAELVAGTYRATGGGNLFAIKCSNCHNASDTKTFGGIHGNAGNASYSSYSSATTGASIPTVVSRKPYRFLPGLGNFRYNGGHNQEAWTRKVLTNASRQGCYTLTGASQVGALPNPSPTKAVASGTNVSAQAIATDNAILGSWGACTDHAGSSLGGAGRSTTRTNLRPLTY
jgi:hypothetical protein